MVAAPTKNSYFMTMTKAPALPVFAPPLYDSRVFVKMRELTPIDIPIQTITTSQTVDNTNCIAVKTKIVKEEDVTAGVISATGTFDFTDI